MLEISDLSKLYNGKVGVSNINLMFEESHIYSVIGPNGSGKTTLIKSIAGIQNISTGQVMLDECSTKLRKSKKHIGFAMDEEYKYPNITIFELLKMICEIKYDGEYYENIEIYLKDFNLYDDKNKLLHECSLGMKKKVGIIISFFGSPKVILLDEPTNGVDTKGIIVLKKYILEAKKQGAIIIITSHVLDFVSAVSDINIFLKDGKVVTVLESGIDLELVYQNIYL